MSKVIHRNCARNLNLTIRTKGICTTQHLSLKLKHTNSPGIFYTNGSPNLDQTTRPYNNQQQQKKRTCWTVDFYHRIKKREKKDKYLAFARELKKLGYMRVMFIPNVIGTLGIVIKGLVKELEDLEIRGRVGAIQSTTLLRSARILRRVLETWGDMLSFRPVKDHQLKLSWITLKE